MATMFPDRNLIYKDHDDTQILLLGPINTGEQIKLYSDRVNNISLSLIYLQAPSYEL